MKQITGVLVLTTLIMMSCQNKSENNMKTGDDSPSRPQVPPNPYYSRTDTTVLDLPDSVWKRVLPDSVYQVARNKATEEAFTGKYWNTSGIGTYYCAACGNGLFRSDAKFASTCGWPSFFETRRKMSVTYQPDNSHGMTRTEVLCGRCGAHLGHLFDDGPPPTGKRYCMNSIVLDFSLDDNARPGR